MLSRVQIKNKAGNFVNYGGVTSETDKIIPNAIIRPFPENTGKGNFISVSLNKGIEIGSCNGRFDKNYHTRLNTQHAPFYFVLCIKGHALSRYPGYSQPVIMAPGKASVYYFEEPVFERQIEKKQDVLSLAIRVSPHFLRQSFCDNYGTEEAFTNLFNKILSRGHFFAERDITAPMKAAFYQILYNRHEGWIGKIYLESKALELIALLLEQVFFSAYEKNKDNFLREDERERIILARDILINQLQTPPSLRELASQAGMSHTRLNKAFRIVFKCTVFEYLRKERLSYARMLIESRSIDLTRVAYESGFCSSSHFAASFQKEYGMRPSDYKKTV